TLSVSLETSPESGGVNDSQPGNPAVLIVQLTVPVPPLVMVSSLSVANLPKLSVVGTTTSFAGATVMSTSMFAEPPSDVTAIVPLYALGGRPVRSTVAVIVSVPPLVVPLVTSSDNHGSVSLIFQCKVP